MPRRPPSMGRSLSPLLRQELDNLDKDADSRRAAMKALKSYARHLDSKSIPHFLAEVSDTTAAGWPPESSPSRSTRSWPGCTAATSCRRLATS